MVARARKHNESFKEYRNNLANEAWALKRRLSGTMGHISITYLKDKVTGLIARKSFKVFNDGRNQLKNTKKQTRQYVRRG